MSKKQLDASGVVSELRGQSLFFRKPEDSAATPPPSAEEQEERSKPERLASQPASGPASQPVSREEIGPIVGRGRMFYITRKVDRWLDETVTALRERGIHKADRSVVVNAILHDPKLYSPEAILELEEAVLKHLANKFRKQGE